MNQYKHVKLEKIIEHNEDTRSFIFDVNFDSRPGQFVMVWLPGFNEKPFSLSGDNMITVKGIGPFTEKLFEKSKGYLDIRGPYGNGFPETREGVGIGGGCGIAPIFYLHSEGLTSKIMLGGKTKEDLLFLDSFERTFTDPSNLITVTEDGSYGVKGIVTDVKFPRSKNNYYVCGPEKMMKIVAEKLVEEGVEPGKIYLNLERYMKCGVGLCGACSISGYRVCADGPVFSYDKVKDLPHFARSKRIKTGELRSIGN